MKYTSEKLPGMPTNRVGICKAWLSFSKRVIFIDVQEFSVSYFTPLHHHDFTGAPSAITSSSRKAKSFSSWLVVFFNLIHGSTLQWLSGVVDQVDLFCSFKLWHSVPTSFIRTLATVAISRAFITACSCCKSVDFERMSFDCMIWYDPCYHTIPNSMYSPMIDFKEIIAGFAVTQKFIKIIQSPWFLLLKFGNLI